MKNKNVLLFSLISFLAFSTAGCNKNTTTSSSGTSGASESSEATKENVNIIMTCATIPPVIAALQSISNGDPTYAWIERGKTYSGIAGTNFVNLGFDPTQNLKNGVYLGGEEGYDGYTPTVNKMKELKLSQPDTHFSIYCTDYKVLTSLAAAFEAGLDEENFTIYMVEDGSATYQYMAKTYLKGKTVEEADALYEEYITTSNTLYDSAKADYRLLKGNDYFDAYTGHYPYVISLATKPNFVHVLQSKTKLNASFGELTNSLVAKAYLGVEGAKYQAHTIYKSISNYVNTLTTTQKDNYLSLMLGQYKDEINAAVHRTKLDSGEAVPSKKLIYIGTRIRQSSLGIAPSFTYSDLASSYASLATKYKDVFSNESDYVAVYNYLMNEENYEDAWKDNSEVVNKVIVAALNNYVGYVYNLKLTYRLYGDTYDIIVKGHPSEVIDETSKWSYKVTVDEVDYAYNEFMNSLAKYFHTSDSEGKYCKLIPNGVAAENLAYLNYDHVVGGLSSSTYTGYDADVPVLYMFNLAEDKTNSLPYLSAESDSILADRFIEDTLDGKCGEDEVKHTYFNKGTLYSTLVDYYTELGEGEVNEYFRSYYQGLYDTFLASVIPSEADVNDYEFNRFGQLVTK